LIYDIFMWKSTLYPSRYFTLLDTAECVTYVCMDVCGLRLLLLCCSTLLIYEHSMFVAIRRYYDLVRLVYSALCGVSIVTG